MATVFPPEIVLHITSFLTDYEAWELREVDSAFLQTALDRRYRTFLVDLSPLPGLDTADTVQDRIRRLRCISSTWKPDDYFAKRVPHQWALGPTSCSEDYIRALRGVVGYRLSISKSSSTTLSASELQETSCGHLREEA